MRKIILFVTSAILMAVSLPALAERIVITEKPVVIEKRGELYYAPETYKVASNYNYVTIDGVQKVCFLERQANLSSEVVTININVNGVNNTWNCYNPDPVYFEIK